MRWASRACRTGLCSPGCDAGSCGKRRPSAAARSRPIAACVCQGRRPDLRPGLPHPIDPPGGSARDPRAAATHRPPPPHRRSRSHRPAPADNFPQSLTQPDIPRKHPKVRHLWIPAVPDGLHFEPAVLPKQPLHSPICLDATSGCQPRLRTFITPAPHRPTDDFSGTHGTPARSPGRAPHHRRLSTAHSC